MNIQRLTNNVEWSFVMELLERKIGATREQYESISTDAKRLPQLRSQLHAYTTLKKELEEAMQHDQS